MLVTDAGLTYDSLAQTSTLSVNLVCSELRIGADQPRDWTDFIHARKPGLTELWNLPKVLFGGSYRQVLFEDMVLFYLSLDREQLRTLEFDSFPGLRYW